MSNIGIILLETRVYSLEPTYIVILLLCLLKLLRVSSLESTYITIYITIITKIIYTIYIINFTKELSELSI